MIESEAVKVSETLTVVTHPTLGAIRLARPAARFVNTPSLLATATDMAPALGEHTGQGFT